MLKYVDIGNMGRTGVSFLILAISLTGQGIPGLENVLERQMRRNARTAALDPGKVQRIPLSLRPQTIGSDAIVVGVVDPAIQVSLRLPDGSVLDEANAAKSGFLWESSSAEGFSFMRSCSQATAWTMITLPPKQPAGEYILGFQSPKTGRRSNVCVSFISLGLGREGEDYETVGSSVTTDQEYYQLGDPVTISVPVLDGGRAVRNARVDAVVSYQDNVVITGEAGRLRLTDAGDGNYTGVFKPAKPAMFNIMVSISGRKQRESGSFRVEPLNGRLLSATLSNPAGRPQARMRFQIYSGGEYRVTPTVRSATGKNEYESIIVDLPPGEHVVTWEPDRDSLKPPYEFIEVHVTKTNSKAAFGSDIVGTWKYQSGQWKAQ